jgi:hypothetical protein
MPMMDRTRCHLTSGMASRESNLQALRPPISALNGVGLDSCGAGLGRILVNCRLAHSTIFRLSRPRKSKIELHRLCRSSSFSAISVFGPPSSDRLTKTSAQAGSDYYDLRLALDRYVALDRHVARVYSLAANLFIWQLPRV